MSIQDKMIYKITVATSGNLVITLTYSVRNVQTTYNYQTADELL